VIHVRKTEIDARIKKPLASLGRLSTGFIRCFGLSAAKWSRWEKRESLSVLLHKPLLTLANPKNDPSAEIGRPKQVRALFKSAL